MTQPVSRNVTTTRASAAIANHQWLIFLAVGVGAFMSALDVTIVSIILPVVTRAFATDIATIEWVVTIYLLVLSSLLLTFGRLGDMRGHKSLYLLGFCVFIVGSALSGLATSAWMLVVFRGVQAVGAAMLASNSLAIITRNFPAARRGQALGMQGMMTYLGVTAGPALGGWLTQHFSWQAVFYVNIPIGIIALALGIRFIPNDAGAGHAVPFDFSGALTFSGGLVALLLALDQGHAWGWTSPAIVSLLVAGILLLGVFLFLEWRNHHPMLDLSLFRTRLFSAAVGSAVLNYVCIYSLVFLMPFYLIQGRGLNPAEAGLLLTAQPLVMAVAAPLSGTLSDRVGSRVPGTIGMAIMSLGVLWLSQLGAASPLVSVAMALAIVGLGTGIFISPNSSALMGSAPREQQGIAAGILATARNVGMVLGVGFAGAIFTTVVASHAESNTAIFDAVSASFVAASVVGALAALVSAVRGK